MITTGDWQASLEPIAKKNHDMGLDEMPLPELNMFYTPVSNAKLTETFVELGDIATMGVHHGSINYANVKQGYQFTVTANQFSQGIKIEKLFVLADRQDIVTGLPNKLGVSARRRQATDVLFPFNNAFNTSITTLDGLQLCSAVHTSNNGGSNQSNRATSALSALSVEAVRIRMTKFLSNTDERIQVNPDMLIVPTDLEEVAYEIIKSSGKVDTAQNNKNFHQGKYKLVVSPWLNDTNNWYMVDSNLMKKSMFWGWMQKLESYRDKDFDTLAMKYADYMVYSYIPRDWRFLLGSEVS